MSTFRSISLLSTFAACFIPGIAFTQDTPSAATASSALSASAPVAYVYVASRPEQTGRIYGYAASANGRLTPIPGSPFLSDVDTLAANGKWFFGTGFSGLLYSYRIAPNGSLKLAASYQSPPAQSTPGNLFLDHTGASLYAGTFDGTGGFGYDAFNINQKTGKLALLNAQGADGSSTLTFIGNNEFAYGVSPCFSFQPAIYGYARVGGGDLSFLGAGSPLPTPPSGDEFCPVGGIAADTHNDVVVPLAQLSINMQQPQKYLLGVYTADKYGNLSTTSTAANMTLPMVAPQFLAMSPRGFYLAVAGSEYAGGDYRSGLQIFLMHGSKSPTPLTGVLLPGVGADQIFWDHYEHLYVISSKTQKLYVFSVATTGSGVKQVAGSPYSIPAPFQFIVLPK